MGVKPKKDVKEVLEYLDSGKINFQEFSQLIKVSFVDFLPINLRNFIL
jgi:hypothetical protein